MTTKKDRRLQERAQQIADDAIAMSEDEVQARLAEHGRDPQRERDKLEAALRKKLN